MMKLFNTILIFLGITGCASLTEWSGYKIRGDTVLWTQGRLGVRGVERIVEGADAESLIMFKHHKYAKDKNYAYFNGKRIRGSHAESFITVDDHHAVDIHRVYKGASHIKTSNGIDFEVISDAWSKDSNDYYYYLDPINVCDRSTFKVHFKNFYAWAHDDKCVYYGDIKVPIKDRESMVLYQSNYSKDKHAVYFLDKIVEGADVNSFGLHKGKYHVHKDKNGCFATGKRVKCRTEN